MRHTILYILILFAVGCKSNNGSDTVHEKSYIYITSYNVNSCSASYEIQVYNIEDPDTILHDVTLEGDDYVEFELEHGSYGIYFNTRRYCISKVFSNLSHFVFDVDEIDNEFSVTLIDNLK
jgi:uncharacterized protein YcfL